MHDPNGAALETIKADECPAEMLGPVFRNREVIEWHPNPTPNPNPIPNPNPNPNQVIEWHRIKDFQIISLKLLAHQLLLGCPSVSQTPRNFMWRRPSGDQGQEIFLPGELSRTRLATPTPHPSSSPSPSPNLSQEYGPIVIDIDRGVVSAAPPSLYSYSDS